MIHARRAYLDFGAVGPKGSAETLPPGAFLVTFQGAQVPLGFGTSVSAGSILRGTSTTLTIRVANSGASTLDWLAYEKSGASSAWWTNTDGAATSLAAGDYQDLVFTFAPPANQAAGTYATEFALSAGPVPLYETTFTITHTVTEPEPEPDTEPPVAPSGFKATAGDGYIDYQWNGVATAETYLLDGGTVQGGPYTVFEFQQAGLSKRVTGLTNGTPYYAVVYALNTITGTSGPATEVACTPRKPPDPDPDPALGTPEITSVSAGQTFVTVRWGGVFGATLYYIRVRNAGGTIVAEGSTATLVATITGLTASTAYTVKVSAFNGTIESPESAPYAFTTSATGSGPGTPALPREDTMTVYMIYNSWIDNPFNNTANIRKVMSTSLAGPTPMRTYGELVGAALANEPSGHRMLSLFHVGSGRTDLVDLATGVTPYTFVESQGYANDSVWAEGMLDFWAGLGVDPEIVALDEENLGYGNAGYLLPFWDTLGASGPERASKFAQIFASETLRKRLPPKLRVSSVAAMSLIDNLYQHPNSYLAGEWNQYILSKRAESLKRIVIDTCVQVRGTVPRYFNYDDERMVRARLRLDGMNYPASTRAMGTITSMPLYIAAQTNTNFILGDGWRAAAGLAPLTKAPRWNDFIRHVNAMRGARQPQFNWFARLRYNGDNVAFDANPQNAVDLLKHAAAMGQREHVWFATNATQSEMNEYQQVIERIEVGTLPARRLPQIPLDADRVVTGDVVTEYDEDAWTAGGTYGPVEV